jgi:flagellar hook-length control protein FliK
VSRREAQKQEVVVEEEVGDNSRLAGQTLTTKPASQGPTRRSAVEQLLQTSSREAGSRETTDRKTSEQKTPLELVGVGANNASAPAGLQQTEAKPTPTREALHQSILSQVKDGALTHDGKGNGRMSIRLNPDELGELKIQVRMDDNRLKVEVQAENRVVKDLLMSNLDSLKEALSGKNFSMERFSVSTSGGGFNSPLREERGNSRQHSGNRFARTAGYAAEVEERVNYLTAEVSTLLDVRF